MVLRLYICSLLLLLLPLTAGGSIISKFQGSIDVSSVNTNITTPRFSTQTGDRISDSVYTIKSLDQVYSLYWQKKFSDYMSTRAFFLYNRLGVDANNNNTWRRDIQPGGELLLNHPKFSFSAIGRRRISENNYALQDVTRDNISASLKSIRTVRYPFVQLRYEYDHNFTPDDLTQRDNSQNRISLTSNYDYKTHEFLYSFNYSHNKIRSGILTSNEYSHIFQWRQHYYSSNRRFRLQSGYLLNYSSVSEKRNDTASSLQLIPYNELLYAADISPELGSLEPLAALGDGDVSTPTDPVIDIGGASLHRNIGVDIGIGQEISGFYIYTNRSSGNDVLWQVYLSDNNLNWQPSNSQVISSYDFLLGRYEIRFQTVAARYIKVVNISVNPSDSVYVTEVQPVITYNDSREYSRSRSQHIVDVSTSFRHTDALESRSEINIILEPSTNNRKQKTQFNFSYQGKYDQSEKVMHVAGVQYGSQKTGFENLNLDNLNINYNLYYQMLELLEFSFVLQNLRSYIGGTLTNETNSVYSRVDGSLLPTLHFSGELSFSRNNQLSASSVYHIYTARTGVNGNLTRRIDFLLSMMIQHSVKIDFDETIDRQQLTSNLNYRMTRNMFFRSNLSVVHDNNTYVRHDYTLSWNLSSRMSASALVGFTSWGDERNTTRLGLNGNLTIKNRGKLYVTYTANDLYDIGGNRINSFQIGYKTGF